MEVRELELARHGLKLLKRNPSSLTPCLDGRYLLLGPNKDLNHSEISKFSKRDADAYPRSLSFHFACLLFWTASPKSVSSIVGLMFELELHLSIECIGLWTLNGYMECLARWLDYATVSKADLVKSSICLKLFVVSTFLNLNRTLFILRRWTMFNRLYILEFLLHIDMRLN